MSLDPDFHNSADAWLDGGATTGQGKVLQEIMENSPPAAREFASLATTRAALELGASSTARRMADADKLLQTSLGKRARNLWTHPAFKWTAAAAVLAIGAAWSMQQSNVAAPDTGIAGGNARKKPLTVPPGPVPQKRLENLPPADTAYTQRMENFIIPDFTANGIELREAITLLADKVTGMGEGAAFEVEIAAPPEGRAPRQVFLNLKYQPASTLLHLIALQTSMKVEASGLTYHLSPDKEPDPEDIDYRLIGAERWQAFRVSQMPPSPPGGGVPYAGQELETPPVANAVSTGLPDLQELSALLLDTVGEAPKSVKLWESPDNSAGPPTLNAGSSQKLNAMLALLLAGDKAPGTLTYEVKWLKLSSHAMTERIMSEYRTLDEIKTGNGTIRFASGSLGRLLADLASDPTVKIETASPLRLAPGRSGSFVSEGSSSSDPALPDWTGQFCSITSSPLGGRTTFEISIKTATRATNGGVSVHTLNNRSTIELGMTTFMAGVMDGSGESMALITARAAGDIPYAIPIAGKPGFVRSPYALEKGEVDVAGIPQGVKVLCPYTREAFRIP